MCLFMLSKVPTFALLLWSFKSFFILALYSLCQYFLLLFPFLFQLTVYIGKRDFYDHIDYIDPIGKWKTVT